MFPQRRVLLKKIILSLMAFSFFNAKKTNADNISAVSSGRNLLGSLPEDKGSKIVNSKLSSENILQILSSPDGYKNIGSCNGIDILRQIEPSFANQAINVTSYYADWVNMSQGPSGGGIFYYDSKDKTTTDDGGACIVTKSGARWKRKILGTIDVQDFGAKGDAKIVNGHDVEGTDDSDAFYNALKYACSTTLQAGASTAINTVSIRIDTNRGFFRIKKPRHFIGEVPNFNKAMGLKFFSLGKSTIFFDNQDDDAELIYNNNQFLFIRFYGLRFESKNLGSICHYSYGDGGAQDCYYFDCDFDGIWKSLLKLKGKNNNSEFGWEKCSTNGRYIVLWDIQDSDQFLNYWAHKCKFWLYTGAHINAQRGGHIKFLDCDWSGIGEDAKEDYNLFTLGNSDHARGVCDFRIINGRFEFKGEHTKFIDSSWNYGNVELVIDMSSQSSLTKAALPMFKFLKKDMAGPKVTIRDSQIFGTFDFITTSSKLYFSPNVVSIRNCQFWHILDLNNIFRFHVNNYSINQWACSVFNCMTIGVNDGEKNNISFVDGNYSAGISKLGSMKSNYVNLIPYEVGFPNVGDDLVFGLPIGSRIKSINVFMQSNQCKTQNIFEIKSDKGNTLASFKNDIEQNFIKVFDVYHIVDEQENKYILSKKMGSDAELKGEVIIEYI